MRKTLREEDKLGSTKMITTIKSWLIRKWLLTNCMLSNFLSKLTKLKLLEPKKFKRLNLLENKKRKEDSKESKVKN